MDTEKYFDYYLLQQSELKTGRYVFLNVYHISKLNYCLKMMGLGLFHTSIEIDEIEYSYGSTEDDFSGIYMNKKNAANCNLLLKEKILLGLTIHTESHILSLLNLHSDFWLGKSYDPFKKNCNDFTKFFAELIIKNQFSKYPLYINRITEFGFFFYCFYSPIKILFGDLIVANNEQQTIELYDKKHNKLKKLKEASFKEKRMNIRSDLNCKESQYDVECEDHNNKNKINFSNTNNKINLSKLMELQNLSQVQINLQGAYEVLDSYKENIKVYSEKERQNDEPLETNKIEDIHLDIQVKNNQNNNLLLKSRRKDNIASSRPLMDDQVKSINRSHLQKENLEIRRDFSMSKSKIKKGNFVKNEKNSLYEMRPITSNLSVNEEKELVLGVIKANEIKRSENIIENKFVDRVLPEHGLNIPG